MQFSLYFWIFSGILVYVRQSRFFAYAKGQNVDKNYTPYVTWCHLMEHIHQNATKNALKYVFN